MFGFLHKAWHYKHRLPLYFVKDIRLSRCNFKHEMVSGQYPPDNIPPGQNPPGQYPPIPISPRTISPRMISLVKHVLVRKKFFNSSVLNYPKTCIGKKNIYIFFNSSVLNYPKSCGGEKKIFFLKIANKIKKKIANYSNFISKNSKKN